MYTPSNTTLAGTITSIGTVDVSLNTFVHMSWMVLLPYTFFGVGLMIYSLAKLNSGERKLKRESKLDNITE